MRKGYRSIYDTCMPHGCARVFILEKKNMRLSDEAYMLRALNLALEAEGNTSPNPMVGCVLVDDEGEIVGEGYHHKHGEPHAEVMALNDAGKLARGTTAYVTLEPCAHYGKTGPCCVALARAGVKKVVCACGDPNPKVAGKGFAYLRQQGIEVVEGVLEKEAQDVNERFLTWIQKGRPFITLKYAMTLDGKIATKTGDSQWITGEEARDEAHHLRKQHDAVLVGVNTVLNDDCQLTTRRVQGKNPKRVVLDTHLQTSLMAQVLSVDAETIIFTGTKVDELKLEAMQALPNVEVVQLPVEEGPLPLDMVITELTERSICSVLVEGGSEVLGAFRDAKLVDRICAFIAPRICGGRAAKPAIGGLGIDLMEDALDLYDVEVEQLGKDIYITGRVLTKEDK